MPGDEKRKQPGCKVVVNFIAVSRKSLNSLKSNQALFLCVPNSTRMSASMAASLKARQALLLVFPGMKVMTLMGVVTTSRISRL